MTLIFSPSFLGYNESIQFFDRSIANTKISTIVHPNYDKQFKLNKQTGWSLYQSENRNLAYLNHFLSINQLYFCVLFVCFYKEMCNLSHSIVIWILLHSNICVFSSSTVHFVWFKTKTFMEYATVWRYKVMPF